MIVRRLLAPDFAEAEFSECLSAIAKTKLLPAHIGKLFNKRIKQGIKTYGAIENGKIVGTASLFMETKFLRNGCQAAHIEDVAAHPDHQGEGVGRMLMEHLFQEAKEAGAYKIILSCEDDVQPFYEKLGYRYHEMTMRKDIDPV